MLSLGFDVLFIATLLHHVVAVRDTLPEPLPRQVASPFIDQRPEDISLVTKLLSPTDERPYDVDPDHHLRVEREEEDQARSAPADHLRANIQNGLLTFLLDAFQSNMKVLEEKEKVLKEYIDCACPDHGHCQRESKSEEGDLKIFPWLFSQSNNFQSKINTLKSAVQKLTTRQHALYEYVNCACTKTTECAKDIKPFLSALFSSDSAERVNEQVLRKLVSPDDSRATNAKIFSNIINAIAHKPSLGDFIAHPIDSLQVFLHQLTPSFLASIVSGDSCVSVSNKPHTSQGTGSAPAVSVVVENKDEKKDNKKDPYKTTSLRDNPPLQIDRIAVK